MRRVLDILLTCNEHITNTITCSHISQFVTTDSVKLSLRPDGTAAYKDPLVRCDQKPCPASQHSAAHLHSAQLHRQRLHDRDRLRGLAGYCECHSEHSEAFGAFPTALM